MNDAAISADPDTLSLWVSDFIGSCLLLGGASNELVQAKASDFFAYAIYIALGVLFSTYVLAYSFLLYIWNQTFGVFFSCVLDLK